MCLDGVCVPEVVDASVPDASVPDVSMDAQVDAILDTSPMVERTSDGLLAAYLFNDGAGTTIKDSAGTNDLTIQGAAVWLPGAIRFGVEGLAIGANASSISNACNASNELTVEAWVRSTQTMPDGPDRIVTFSQDFVTRNFMFGLGSNEGPRRSSQL